MSPYNILNLLQMRKTLIISLIAFSFAYSLNAQNFTYYFNGDFTEASGGPALTEVLSCAATNGTFTTQPINTSSGSCNGGSPQPVFAFTEGGGLSFPNNDNISGTYTIHMFFKFNALSGYQRIIDFQNGTTDNGLYTLNDCLNFYPTGNVPPCPYFVANTFYLFTLVRDSTTKNITVYVNGAAFTTYNDAADVYASPTSTTPIIFFRDNVPPSGANCEDRDGSIKYLYLSPTISTATQVDSTFTNICSIALPLRLITISAKKENRSVILNWQTDNEVNVDRFEVERSSDGTNFKKINNVQARNQSEKNNYRFKDVQPGQGTNYYRIKIVDRDGTFKYSSVIKINIDNFSIFQVYPNPVKYTIVVTGLTFKKTIWIRTIDGKVLAQHIATGESMSIDMSSYSKGIYLLEYDGKEIQRVKVVKQ